jgi:2-polyprenyl-3-methyl-5-hydroxy-6-metoxy-1,4-benzoquinol methylase
MKSPSSENIRLRRGDRGKEKAGLQHHAAAQVSREEMGDGDLPKANEEERAPQSRQQPWLLFRSSLRILFYSLFAYGLTELVLSFRKPTVARNLAWEWAYELKEERGLDPSLQPLVKTLHRDDETEVYLRKTWPLPYILYWFRSQLSRQFGYTAQDASAMVGGNPMFVLSSSQFDQLLPYESPGNKNDFSLLDVGSGDGAVTRKLAHRFAHVSCMEVSSGMRRLLRKRGSPCTEVLSELPTTTLQNRPTTKLFDVISMLNVLDRVHEPAKLLESLKPLLRKDGGRLFLAQVSPYWARVATNSTTSGWEHAREPFLPLVDRLRTKRKPAEVEASIWVKDILEPAGWIVESLSRVPYLCPRHSFAKQKFAVMHDLIFVLKLPDGG